MIKSRFSSILVLAMLALAPQAVSKNYYVDSAQGSDDNTGTSQSAPWRTITKANTAQLLPGDSLLFRRGGTFGGILEISAKGKPSRRIVVGAYGDGRKPCIKATDGALYAVQVRNSDYLTLRDIEVVNTGSVAMPTRTGVKVACLDYGTSHDIILDALYIHDVNGSLIKEQGGGSGLLIVNGGKKRVSTFDGLTIENCVLRRCARNGMIWSAYWSRDNWHPNRRVVVRRNLLEEVPGDGIVPIGCEGALIEYNLMRNCPGTLPHSEAAAGFWPWSCDNTVMQHNEVSDHKAPWDAQGFDSDYNCSGTTIQFNYSHDNDGGMLLICNSGKSPGAGNRGTLAQYNVSINDAIRPRATRSGIFSANIHIAGPCDSTLVRRNILHVNPKTEPFIDRSIITSDSWDGYATRTTFSENIFYAPEPTEIRLTGSTDNIFSGNYFLGTFRNLPADAHAHHTSDLYNRLISRDPCGFTSLDFLFDSVIVGDGAAVLRSVNPAAIESLFQKL